MYITHTVLVVRVVMVQLVVLVVVREPPWLPVRQVAPRRQAKLD
jgi:hypothetical protein